MPGSISGGAGPLGETITEGELSLSDNTTNDTSETKHGFCPKLPGNADEFLNGAGEFVEPPGGGVTNSAGANVVPKSDGTNLVASALSAVGNHVTLDYVGADTGAIFSIDKDSTPQIELDSSSRIYMGQARAMDDPPDLSVVRVVSDGDRASVGLRMGVYADHTEAQQASFDFAAALGGSAAFNLGTQDVDGFETGITVNATVAGGLVFDGNSLGDKGWRFDPTGSNENGQRFVFNAIGGNAADALLTLQVDGAGNFGVNADGKIGDVRSQGNGTLLDINDTTQTVSFTAVNGVNFSSVAKLAPLAFASLPASPSEGMMAWITDSDGDAWGDVVTGGGALKRLIVYNGSAWHVFGK